MTEQQRALEWIASDDTGISSKTIWAVMMGTEISRDNIPLDPADFGRCYRLLKLIPEWEARLPEVAAKYPKWEPMVREWAEMKRLYNEEHPQGRAPRLYALMKELEKEGQENDADINDKIDDLFDRSGWPPAETETEDGGGDA